MYEQGSALYQQGRFLQAAEAFERAFALSRRPALWWNIYLAWRDAGRTAQATEALRRYLATASIDPAERASLQARLAALEQFLEEHAAEAATAASSPQQASTHDDASAEAPSQQPPSRGDAQRSAAEASSEPGLDGSRDRATGGSDWQLGLGVGSLALGGVAAIVSVVFGVMALDLAAEQDRVCTGVAGLCPGDYDVDETTARFETWRAASWTVAISGAVFVAAGAALLAAASGGSGESSASRESSARAPQLRGTFAAGPTEIAAILVANF